MIKLQASGIHRATNCPGSLRLEQSTPEELQYRPFTEAATFGTKVHDIAEDLLVKEFKQGVKPGAVSKWLKDAGFIKGSADWDRAENAVKHYQKHYKKIARAHKKYKGKTSYIIEEKFRAEIDGFDCVAKADSAIVTETKDAVYLDFMDLKTGNFDYSESAGLQIEYGALLWLVNSGIDKEKPFYINMHIVQPNYYNDPEKVVVLSGFARHSASHLIASRVSRIKENINTQTAGEHCRFCRAVLVCPALAARVDFAKSFLDAPAAPVDIATGELEKLYLLKPLVETYFKAVEGVLFDRIGTGAPFDLLTVALSSGHRRWIDKKDAEKKLSFLGDDMYKPRDLKTPAQMEKLAGKENIADLYDSPKIKKLVEREQPFNKIS